MKVKSKRILVITRASRKAPTFLRVPTREGISNGVIATWGKLVLGSLLMAQAKRF